jgi:hypothetical protein
MKPPISTPLAIALFTLALAACNAPETDEPRGIRNLKASVETLNCESVQRVSSGPISGILRLKIRGEVLLTEQFVDASNESPIIPDEAWTEHSSYYQTAEHCGTVGPGFEDGHSCPAASRIEIGEYSEGDPVLPSPNRTYRLYATWSEYRAGQLGVESASFRSTIRSLKLLPVDATLDRNTGTLGITFDCSVPEGHPAALDRVKYTQPN